MDPENALSLMLPRRYWLRFLPAWVSLMILPFGLIAAAHSDNVDLYFWLLIAPVLFFGLLPVARLFAQGSINIFQFGFWTAAVPLVGLAALLSLYQLFRAVLS